MKIAFKILLGCYILFMIGFYFKRYFYSPLDGDLPAIVLPVKAYTTVMQDPFGMNVLLYDSVYHAPNRFFAHFFMTVYFRNVPIWLQQLFSPIDSIYIACAFFRTFTQFFLIFLIACYVTNKKIWHLDFLMAAAFCIPLFQTYGYYIWMAIIDSSVTYTFFYAFSLSLILLFFLPFFNGATGRRDFNFGWTLKTGLAILSVVIAFCGPLNAPVMLLACSAVLLNYYIINFKSLKNLGAGQRLVTSFRKIPPVMRSLFIFAMVVCLYSFYIGRNNAENQWFSLSLAERYSRLPTGFWYQYTFKLAQPLLIGIVLLNTLFIYILKPNTEASKVMRFLKWFGVIAVIYILMLPLGGYRIYRENIVRFDTVMPVTLGLILFYSYTAVYLINKLQNRYKLAGYCILIAGFSAAYINADWGMRKDSKCERAAFEEIAASKERIVLVDRKCSVMNWGLTANPGESKTKAAMMLYWNIIPEQKLYYQNAP